MTSALTEWFKNPSEIAGQSCPTCTPPTKKWFVSDPPGMAGNANVGGK